MIFKRYLVVCIASTTPAGVIKVSADLLQKQLQKNLQKQLHDKMNVATSTCG